MPLSFKSVGSLTTNPFTPDGDPNTSAPAAARIFEIPDLTETGERAFGVKFYPEYTNPSVGTVNITVVPWVYDESGGNWVSAVAESGVENRDLLVSSDLAPGRVFFQITAVNGGTIDSVEFFAAAA